ncbi:SDR family NAD(P)-dependent oxidoreductase [Parvibaculum sp.]|jgi:NAD(P)-dependent dehydrogenase (short-subunit alcohol dehydrogenase family)|uniref:SDR family NAD(P)-dependent oxidoreductase n=1 Tax=Parvibaculum sp. TaxID=2024848 RepID=UPI000C3FD7E1|nr:SDR family NAD(P)-dependent oxidoreductase [Parvibaculum sp.]MAM93621.1 short-chain dehydrogenase [Parvibaculum sp.]|tara:strand:+ start:45514 stop:46293 length:780 start_codon:yes stop_codon:yes gene_type:complete
MADATEIEMPSYDLSGKVALVTGATSGLGRRFSLILAKAGASVAITGRRVERLEALKKEIEALGGRSAAIALDVTDTQSISDCVAEAERALGPLDILVNNAGMNVQALPADVTPDGFDTMFDTNVRGAFFMAQAAGRSMIARGQGGRIINIASIGAHTVLPGLTIYCMTKAAVAMMTKSLGKEWARHQINVNAMCPGFIETELNSEWFQSEGGQRQIKTWPRRRLGVEEDLDGTLLLLASDHGRFITGSLFTVDDGQSL